MKNVMELEALKYLNLEVTWLKRCVMQVLSASIANQLSYAELFHLINHLGSDIDSFSLITCMSVLCGKLSSITPGLFQNCLHFLSNNGVKNKSIKGTPAMYAFFDGDNIGSTIEILLTEGRIEEASKLSKNIQVSLIEIEEFLKLKKDVEIIILGGDDILINYSDLEEEKALLEGVRSRFFARTGNTMSCGVSENLSKAIWNLHLAKLYGKNMIEGKN